MSQKTISSADTGRLSGMDMDSQQVEEDEDTRNALFEYVVERASRDQTLSREQATTFTRVQHQTGRGNHTEAALVGRRLAELGKFQCCALIRFLRLEDSLTVHYSRVHDCPCPIAKNVWVFFCHRGCPREQIQ